MRVPTHSSSESGLVSSQTPGSSRRCRSGKWCGADLLRAGGSHPRCTIDATVCMCECSNVLLEETFRSMPYPNPFLSVSVPILNMTSLQIFPKISMCFVLVPASNLSFLYHFQYLVTTLHLFLSSSLVHILHTRVGNRTLGLSAVIYIPHLLLYLSSFCHSL